MQALVPFTLAVAGSLALTPLARRAARKHGLVSRPDGNRKLEARPIPLLGGGSVYLALLLGIVAVCVVLATARESCALSVAMGLSAGMLCLLGCCDDSRDINAKWKLLGQVLATLPVVMAGCYVERLVLFGFVFEMGWLGILWTIGWLVLGINAMNLLDGMDGLASTVGIVVSAAISALAATQGQYEVMLLALVLAGALSGFLVYNLPPARIYLGDCGSLTIGFSLSLLALQVSHGSPATANVAVAVALLFVPLLDTLLAILRRTVRGKSFMSADRGHVHHRLLDQGYNVWQVLGLLGTVCLIAAGAAWLASVWQRELWAWIALPALTVLLVNRRLVGHQEWELTRRWLTQIVLRTSPQQRTAPETEWLRVTGPTFTEVPPQEHVAGEIVTAGRMHAEIGAAKESSKVAA